MRAIPRLVPAPHTSITLAPLDAGTPAARFVAVVDPDFNMTVATCAAVAVAGLRVAWKRPEFLPLRGGGEVPIHTATALLRVAGRRRPLVIVVGVTDAFADRAAVILGVDYVERVAKRPRY